MERSRYLYLLIALPLLYFALFKYLPIYGVQIAFRDFKIRDGILGSTWVGLAYFREFISDASFWNIFRNTILLSLQLILFGFPAPVIFALLVNELRFGGLRWAVERVSCFPHFISTVIVVSILTGFVSKDGLVNQILVSLGGKARSFLLEPESFRPLFVISDLWQEVGWGAVIYLAALAGVDPQLYEACEIDGGGRWHKLIHVTLPCIEATILIMFILRMGSVMGVSFEKALLMQNANTFSTSDVIQTYVYRRGLQGAQYSYATAVNVFESVINLTLLLAANAFTQRMGRTSLW